MPPCRVVTFKIGAQIVSILAEYLPVILDNAIKTEQERFMKAIEDNLRAEDILRLIPITHPTTNFVDAAIPGVSRYPVDRLTRYIDHAAWMAIAMTCYSRNPVSVPELAVFRRPDMGGASAASILEVEGWIDRLAPEVQMELFPDRFEQC